MHFRTTHTDAQERANEPIKPPNTDFRFKTVSQHSRKTQRDLLLVPLQQNQNEQTPWLLWSSSGRGVSINILERETVRNSTMPRRPPTRNCLFWLLACGLLLLSKCIQAVPVQLYGINYNTRKGADFNWYVRGNGGRYDAVCVLTY